ncbi:MAG: rod shape-determining protein MreD [Anaerolineales bacterium]
MSLIYGVPILILAAVFQSVWFEGLDILGGRPDLVLTLVITWAIIRGMDEGMVWGFLGGLFCDILSGGPLGLWTVSLTFVAFIVGQPWVNTLGPTSIRLALMSAIGTLIGHTLFLALMNLLGYPVSAGRAFAEIIGPAALLNFILSPFSFRFLVWFHQRSLRPGGASL